MFSATAALEKLDLDTMALRNLPLNQLVSQSRTLAATAVTGDGSGLTSLMVHLQELLVHQTTPIITVDSNGRITGISTVATAGAGGGRGISNIVEDTHNWWKLRSNSKDITGSVIFD